MDISDGAAAARQGGGESAPGEGAQSETVAARVRPSRGRWIVSALLVAALVWGGVAAAGKIGAALHTVVAVDAAWLVVAGLFEAGSYVLLGAVLRRIAGDRGLSYGDAVRAGLVTSGLGTILPAAPAEGMVMAARELEARGIPRRRTFLAVGLGQWYFARALFGVGAAACLFVATLSALRGSDLDPTWPWMLAGGATLGVAFIVTGVVVRRSNLLTALARHARRLPFCARHAERISASCRAWSTELQTVISAPGNRMRLLTLAGGATLADAACFVFALRAAGVRSAITVLLVAYAIGMLATFVPLLPAGIGMTEAAVPAFLHHSHVPLTIALGGVLAYRALGTLMPAFVGAGALAQLRLARHRSTMRHLPHAASDGRK